MKQKKLKSMLAFLLVLCMVFCMQGNIVFAQDNDVSSNSTNITDTTTDSTENTDSKDATAGTEKKTTNLNRSADPASTNNDSEIAAQSGDTMSGSCGATENDDVTWKLEQNNEDNDNPTYTLTISGTGAMANLNTSTETENSTSGNSSYPWSEHSSNITKIVVGDGVTSIGSKAFIGYQNVTSVKIGKNVSGIGAAALSQLSACTKFDVSGNNSFTTDETGVLFDSEKTKLIAFPCASSVTEYEVPDTVKTIAYGAFSRAANLQTITIPASSQLETVGYGAFAYTTALKTVRMIPTSMTNIGDLPFSASGVKYIYCAGADTKTLVQGKVDTLLVDVLLADEAPAAEFTENGYAYWIDDGEAVIVSAPKNEQTPTVPSSVTYESKTYPVTGVWRGAFAISTDWSESNSSSDKRNETITSVTLPASITQIGERAFYFCKNLSNITIQASEVTIDDLAFATQNSSGTTLDFSAVTELNITSENAWNGVGKVILNNRGQLDTIKSNVKVDTIAVVGNNEWKKTSDGTWEPQPKTNLTAKVDDITWTFDVLDGKATLTAYEPKTTKNVTVPSAVTVDNDTYMVVGLGKGLFGWNGDWSSTDNYNKDIESVVLPDTITTIGADMFRYSTNLKSVTIQGKSIVFENGRTFSGTNSLKMLDISSVESVEFGGEGTSYFSTISSGPIIYVSSDMVKSALTTHGANSSKIIFAVTNGGTVGASDSGNTKLNNTLTKANYKFSGWYDNEECTGTAVTIPEVGKTYYAKWEAKTTSTISFKDTLKLDKTYDDNAVSLSSDDYAVTGDDREVTFSYQVKDGETWKDIDTAPTNAGTYRVKAMVAEDDTYASAETDWKEFTISKAAPIYIMPTDLTAVAGQTLADVTLPEGFAWQDDETTSVGSVGTNTFKVTYTPADTANYNTVSDIEISLTVNPKMEVLNAVPVITAEDKTITAGDTFDPLDGVTASDKEDGEITDDIEVISNNVDTSNAGTYEVTYKVTDSKGASATKTITVTVKEKDTQIAATDDNKTPNGTDTDKAAADSAKTGDDSNIMIWLALLVLSGVLLTVTAVMNRRKSIK